MNKFNSALSVSLLSFFLATLSMPAVAQRPKPTSTPRTVSGEGVLVPAPESMVRLNCIPRGGPLCDGPGFSCLVLFPFEEWASNMRKTPELEKQTLSGRAYISGGERRSLHYEFASPPSADVSTFPLDRDIPLDERISNSLGYSGVTILKGKYGVDRKMGDFGGVMFDVKVTVRIVRDNEIGILHNEALEFLYKHPGFLKILAGKKRGVFTPGDVSQIQSLLKQFMLGKGLNADETENASNRFSRFLTDVGVSGRLETPSNIARLDNQSRENANSIPILAAQKGYLSLTVAEQIVKAQQMAAEKKELRVILEYMGNQVRPRLQLKDDIRRIDVLVSVCRSSQQFWTSNPQRMKPGTGTILADGVGAAYGLLLGPIGSIFYGTFFSVLANESD